MKKYVYVPSYQGLFFAEYLNCKYSNVTVLTSNKKVRRLLESSNSKFQYINLPPCNPLKLKYYFTVKSFIRQEILNIEKQSELFFCHNAFDVAGFYIVKIWASVVCGSVYYCDMDPRREKFNYKELLKGKHLAKFTYCLIQKALIRFIWGLSKIELLATPNPVLGISNLFQYYYSIQKFEECRPDIIRKFVPKIFYDSKEPILYLSDTDYEFERKVLNQISIYKKKILIKPHPSTDNTIVFDGFRVAPEFIPAESLFSEKKIVIGVASAAMREALKNDILTISLLKLYYAAEPESERAKFLLDFIVEDYNGNKLKLPASIEEFLKIIEEHY